jgi:hypothetical protein
VGRIGQPRGAVRPVGDAPGPPRLPGTLVRLAVGLEAVADLQADLAQALAVLGR